MGILSRFWLIVWTSSIHMTSAMMSSSELSGVRMSPEEIQRRWELLLNENVLVEPERFVNDDEVKLTELWVISGSSSQNRETPSAMSSVCESRSRHLDWLSHITLLDILDGMEPLASQYIPPPSPLRSSPLISASVPSSLTE